LPIADCRLQIAELIRERGPLTVAAFMDAALYDSTWGYYARSAQRSGRAGDFFTSVDVGALFGELLAVQIVEMADFLASNQLVRALRPAITPASAAASFDLVEAGAGNGRLAADILRAIRRRRRSVYETIHLHLVEASAAARAAHRVTLGEVGDRLASS